MQDFLVMPGRTLPVSFGVTTVPLILNMTFIEPTSSMLRRVTPSSQRTCEKPCFSARSPARMEQA